MGLTTDRNDPDLKVIEPGGQQKTYLVLSEEERSKGFVMPLQHGYTHLKCGGYTLMGQSLCETYARDPHFYGGTFCCNCGNHFPLRIYHKEAEIMEWQFIWQDGSPVGADREEADEYAAEQKTREAQKNMGDKI